MENSRVVLGLLYAMVAVTVSLQFSAIACSNSSEGESGGAGTGGSSNANGREAAAGTETDASSNASGPEADAGSEVDAGSVDATEKSDFRLQFQSSPGTGKQTDEIVLMFRILCNTVAPLDEITLRYWYTPDQVEEQTLDVTYANIDTSLILWSLESDYVEIGFVSTAGDTSVGGDIQVYVVITSSGGSEQFDQTNDWSYNAGAIIEWHLWDHVTIYRDGVLVYGIEPEL